MDRLFTLLADHWPVEPRLASKCAGFAGDLGPAGVSLPLRIAGGLHALRLSGDEALAAIYPPHRPGDDAFLAGIVGAVQRHRQFLSDWVDSPPQTNELRRSSALIPAARLACEEFGLPIRLSELGASAGLNLIWDRYALAGPGWRVGPADAVLTLSPDWTGPPPPESDPVIADRRGVDLMPLDPADPEDLLRLSAYLWPDQPERLELTRAAAGAMSAAIDRGDAIEWLEKRLDSAPSGQLHLVQNTIAWQYFAPEAQEQGRALIDAAGARATNSRPLAWIQLESDGDRHGQAGAAITLQTWPGGEARPLGRADFHGRWVRWQPGDFTSGLSPDERTAP